MTLYVQQDGLASLNAKKPGYTHDGGPASYDLSLRRRRNDPYFNAAAAATSGGCVQPAADIGSGLRGDVLGGWIVTAPFFLNRADRDRLSKLAGMLGSSHDGERAAAAMMATKLLEAVGASWADLVASVPVKSPPRYHTLPETRRAAAKMRVPS